MSDHEPSTGDAWMTTDQAAAYLGFPSVEALYQAVRRGHIPSHRIGRRRLRFRRSELDRKLTGGR